MAVAATGFASVSAQPVVEDSVLALIEQHTMDNGQVMEIARTMTDINGPRLTGSPGLAKATEWTVEIQHGSTTRRDWTVTVHVLCAVA